MNFPALQVRWRESARLLAGLAVVLWRVRSPTQALAGLVYPGLSSRFESVGRSARAGLPRAAPFLFARVEGLFSRAKQAQHAIDQLGVVI